MKNTAHWKDKLARQLIAHRAELGGLSVRQFLDVELALFLAHELIPNVPPAQGVPALLAGYDYPFTEQAFWTEQHHRYRRTARFGMAPSGAICCYRMPPSMNGYVGLPFQTITGKAPLSGRLLRPHRSDSVVMKRLYQVRCRYNRSGRRWLNRGKTTPLR